MTKAAARVGAAVEDVVADSDADQVKGTDQGYVKLLSVVVGVNYVVKTLHQKTLWPVVDKKDLVWEKVL